MGPIVVFEKLEPVALAFGGGAIFARRKIISAEQSKLFVDFTFLFAIPCYLFGNIYRSDLHSLFNWRAIVGYALTAMFCMFLVGGLAYLLTSRESRAIALRVMASVQVNTAYFAVPVFIMLFDNAAPIFPILLFQTCVLSLIVISVMELGGTESVGGPAGRLVRAIWGSLKTPIIVACNVAILLNLLSVRLPAVLMDGFSFVGNSSSPVALFALGLYLGGAGISIKGTSVEEIWLIAFKCVVFPLTIWVSGNYVFGISGPWLTYLVLIAAMPAPQNLFIFAQRYDVGVDMSASLVVKSSVTTLFLLPLWIQLMHVA